MSQKNGVYPFKRPKLRKKTDYFKSDVALHYVKNPLKGELFLSDEVRATQMIEEGRFNLTPDEQNKILGFINNINEDLEGSPFKISYRI